MYTTAVQCRFIAQHFLIGGDWGAENELHSHAYRIEAQLVGETLDANGYMTDIDEITQALESVTDAFRDHTLNELPEFRGLNPSIEHLAHILWRALALRLHAPNLTRLRVQVWENEVAWTAYEENLQPMRVGLVIYGGLDTLSGGYLYDRKLVEFLRSRGDTVEIISLPWRNYARHLLDNASVALYAHLRDAAFDVLVQDELNHPSLAWLNGRLRGRVRYPIVSLVHHLRACERHPPALNLLYRPVERRYLASVDGFILNSETTRREVARLLGYAPERVIVANPAGDRFHSDLTPEAITARAHAPGPLRIVFVGNVIPRKGLHVLLDAVRRLPRDAWTLTVAGRLDVDAGYAMRCMSVPGEFDHLTPTLPSLQRRGGQGGVVREESSPPPRRFGGGAGGEVRFLGSIPDDVLARVLAESHVLAVPSDYEGFGIVYLEGMAFGLPALATTSGAAGEIITEGENGWRVPPSDAVALAARLAFLARDRDRLARMGLAARQRYLAHPRWNESMERIRAALAKWTT